MFKINFPRFITFIIFFTSMAMAQNNGPLFVHPDNPRYFSDQNKNFVYLTGSHTWSNFQDIGDSNPPRIFDYSEYLNFLVNNNHNFFRLWTWEQSKWVNWDSNDFWIDPLPYMRPGPGLALDGKPKFNLDHFNQDYFDRLRNRIIAAGQLNIYVSIMLFNGFSVEKNKGGENLNNPWKGHPFNINNNINNINGDSNNDNSGSEVHTLVNSQITAIQESYVKKVIDSINDLDNVLYEISNESAAGATEWQYHMINFIKNYESSKPKQHPVGMTVEWPGGTNSELFNSPADWVSPNGLSGDYYDNPEISTGSKIIISDTDHLCGICGNRSWVWKSFLRGINPILMDVYKETDTEVDPTDPIWDDIRKNLGYTREYSRRINLLNMTPQNSISSSSYCLANTNPDSGEYLIYLPYERNVTVDLSSQKGNLEIQWRNPENGHYISDVPVTGGKSRIFINPFNKDAVLYIYHPVSTAQIQNPKKVESNIKYISIFPNPFNSSTSFKYYLQTKARVHLVIYNILGQEIRILIDDIQVPGEKVVRWDGKDLYGYSLSSGLYLFELSQNSEIQFGKLVYLK